MVGLKKNRKWNISECKRESTPEYSRRVHGTEKMNPAQNRYFSDNVISKSYKFIWFRNHITFEKWEKITMGTNITMTSLMVKYFWKSVGVSEDHPSRTTWTGATE